jgi:hypothetical protein
VRIDQIKKAVDEQARSSFPDIELDKYGNPEKLLVKNHRRRTEKILNEMVDNMLKDEASTKNNYKKRKKRKRRRGPKVYVYSEMDD